MSEAGPYPFNDDPGMRFGWAHPWIVREAVEHLEPLIQPWHRVLEWGSGGSTIWFARRAAHVTTIEHNPFWGEALTLYMLDNAIRNIELQMREADYPEFNRYSTIDNPGIYDVILIDGIDGYDNGLIGSRLACARVAIEHIAHNGIIVLDNAGSASNIEAAKLIEAKFPDRRKFVGYVLEPPGHHRDDQTETSIFICP